MSVSPPFTPTSVDLGLVAPGSVTPSTIGTTGPLAAAATVSAVIETPSVGAGVLAYQAFTVTSVGPPPSGTGPVHTGPIGGLGGAHGGVLGATVAGAGIGGSTGVGHGGAEPRTQERMVRAGGVTGVVGPVVATKPGPVSVTGTIPSGQPVIVDISFTSGPFRAGVFKANLVLSCPDWNDNVTIPLTAQVVDISLTCRPAISVTENATAQFPVTVTSTGPATTATLMTTQESWPQGVTVSIQPATLSLVSGVPQTATVSITAALDAPPAEADLIVYATGFGTFEYSCQTSLTVAKLVLKPSPIAAKYQSFPNAAQVLGQPIAPEQFCMDYVGQFRAYQHGAIYWNGQAGDAAYEINGPVLPYYLYYPDPPTPGGPTIGDYSVACGDYPISDTLTISTGSVSHCANDQGIYATALGVFGVAGDAFYQANGGPTGGLGVPVAQATGGQAGLSGSGTMAYVYQDFANGAIFAVPAPPGGTPFSEQILFASVGSTPSPFSFKASGSTLAGSLYIEPNPPPELITIPLWALATFPVAEVTQLINTELSTQITKFNKTASTPVELRGDATVTVGGYVQYKSLPASRTYDCSFSLYAGGCLGLVGGLADVTFQIYFALTFPTADGGVTALQATLINPAVSWSQDGPVNITEAQQNQGTAAILNTLKTTVINIPLPLTYKAAVPKSTTLEADLDLAWTSAKVLADGTLGLLATLIVTKVSLKSS